MFYSQFILAKKGPLGTIWIAAHLERKLRKNQVADTDISVSVDSILFPDVPIALRLSSHLLLGVVRIYSRKVNYLFDDCSEALLKVKQAFRSTAVDLPPEESTAPYHSITLPETFDLDDFELPDSENFHGNYDHHVSTREQITLQDTMEGVVFSTTQFGLDERFGDGDTSGLDLDEELFLSKGTVPGQPEVVEASDPETHQSTQPLTPFEPSKDAEEPQGDTETADFGGYDDPMDYAHAPSTPGLVEEPNFSKVQGAVCDDHLALGDDPKLINGQDAAAGNDHMELEDQNMCAAKENITSISQDSDLHHGMPNASDTNSIQQKSDEIRTSDPAMEFHGAQDGVFSDNGPTTDSVNAANAEKEETLENGLDNIVSCPSSSQEAPVLKDPSENTCSVPENVSEKSCFQPVSEDPYQDASRPEVSNNDEEMIHPVNGVLASDIEVSGGTGPEDPQTQACPELKGSETLNAVVPEKLAFGDVNILRRCNHLDQSSSVNNGDVSGTVHLPSEMNGPCAMDTSEVKEAPDAPEASTVIQGEGCPATDSVAPVSEEYQTTEPASHEDIRVHSMVSGDTLSKNIETSETSELPAVEKLLSVPEAIADPQNNMLEFTPANVQLGTTNEGDAGVDITSGRKRSFAESSLTVQSIDSVDSMEAVRSKRARESVPDDDDLLSSILVGRRSSVLKVKATPPVQEIVRQKRPRSTPRASALKRKVLMDDTMVLHGDIIRQQLTNTEDIRRTRKKAPCTRSEIWMIQKELLEDDFFSEPILTGLSAGLASLHTQTYDLSRIRISQDDTRNSVANAAPQDENDLQKATNDLELPAEPNIEKEIATEGIIESNILGNDMVAECPNNQEALDNTLESTGNATELQATVTTDEAEPQCLSHEHSALVAGIEREDLATELNPPAGPVVEPTLATDPAFGDNRDNQETNVEGSFHIEASGLQSDEKLDPLSVEKEIPEDSDAVKITEENEDLSAVGEATVSTGREEPPLNEVEEGASLVVDHVDMTLDQSLQDMFMDELPTKEVEFLATGLDYDGRVPPSYGSTEEPNLSVVHPEELDGYLEHGPMNGEYPSAWEADPQSTVNADSLASGHADIEDHTELGYALDGHDTGFLNADDDDIADEDECYVPSPDRTEVDTSGWSSRTRAVAKYLQVLFEKEPDHGKKTLPMDNLLVGKTRKEASRMFFEALVLKTRDYVHVEQANPFEKINIKPGVKMMKSNF